jgi:hypothetical protein
MRRARAHPASTQQILELRDRGLTRSEVAEQVDMTVSGAWSRYRKAQPPKPQRLGRWQQILADALDENNRHCALCYRREGRGEEAGMPSVPTPCSALADQLAALEADEESLRAALPNLSGFAAWAALVRLSRIPRELDKFRSSLAGCIDIAQTDGLLPAPKLKGISGVRLHAAHRPEARGPEAGHRERECVRLTNGETGDYSSFLLVNYLPVAAVHEAGCQLVDHVALVQLNSVDT